MTQNETLLLGIDIGTTGTKCAIYDLKGELVAHAYQEYSMIHPQPSWAEQDPHRWWNAVQTNLRDCFEQQGIDSSRIASIGLSCTNAMTRPPRYGEQTGQGLVLSTLPALAHRQPPRAGGSGV